MPLTNQYYIVRSKRRCRSPTNSILFVASGDAAHQPKLYCSQHATMPLTNQWYIVRSKRRCRSPTNSIHQDGLWLTV